MRTNTTIIRNQVKAHILDTMPLEDLKANVQAVKHHNINDYQAGCELVSGGSFLIYNDDIELFLNGLGINPENKKYSNDRIWKLYAHLVASEIEKLVRSK